MSYSRKYTGWDNSDREDFYEVDRYDWSGNYAGTDVYNEYDEKIDSYRK